MPALVQMTARMEPGEVPRAEHLHGLFSNWLESHLTDAEHRAPQKGFRVAPARELDAGRMLLRVGLVDDGLFPLLERRAELASVTGIRLGSKRAELETDGGRVLEIVSAVGWTDILQASSARSTYRFEFLSPTAFRSGREMKPVPAPGLIFGHLRARWSAFAPPELTPHIDFRECGFVQHVDCAEVPYELKRRKIVGFVGSVQIAATEGTPREHRVLDALARLSPFCGVGTSTTMGMGDVAYIPEPG